MSARRRLLALLTTSVVVVPNAAVVAAPGETTAAEVSQQTEQPADAKLKAETAKLKAETAKLQEEKEKLSDEHGNLADFARFAPFLTAIVALIGLFLTLRKQIDESKQLRSQNAEQRTKDREQREKDRTQRFDEQFNRMVDNLGSDKPATRAAATAQIATYLRPEHEAFHEQVFLLLLAALRYPRDDVGDKILVRTFQRAARDRIPAMREQDPELRLDLSYCCLARVDLSELNLDDSDLRFADLHRARLAGTKLRRVRGYKVNLRAAFLEGADLLEADLAGADIRRARFTGQANLVSAKLKEADATGAHFQRARMQEAHLEGATLLGARFEEAVLTNAYFARARFDDATLRSIANGAVNWRDANFDQAVCDKLKELSAADETKGARPPGGRRDTPPGTIPKEPRGERASG